MALPSITDHLKAEIEASIDKARALAPEMTVSAVLGVLEMVKLDLWYERVTWQDGGGNAPPQ